MAFTPFKGYIKNIRLTQEEVDAIKTCFKSVFADQGKLWIFGSRVQMDAKGGDIDLYIETSIKDPSTVNDKRVAFLFAMQDKIGEQKIDIVINTGGDFKLPIYEVAKRDGVRLI